MKFVFPDASYIELTEVACALILGIIVNVVVNLGKKNKEEPAPAEDAPQE